MGKLGGLLCGICAALSACNLPTGGGLSSAASATRAVVAAEENHTVVLKSDGTVWGWGLNDYGQVSTDNSNTYVENPVQVAGLTGAPVVSVASGGYHTLALRSDGTVLAWGMNGNGELGDGSTSWDHGIGPVQVRSLTGIVAVAAGYWHSVALKNDGTVWAWGATSQGVLGDPSAIDGSTPVKVVGLSGVVAVSAGTEFNLALKNDGTVWAWGDNSYGQLGDGKGASDAYSAFPVMVNGLTGVAAISAGYDHALALKNDGTVWAWGRDDVYQCGVDYVEGVNELVPVRAGSLSGVVTIAAGGWHNLALKSDGTLLAWGSNSYRESGSGSEDVNILVPVAVSIPTGERVARIAAGENHSIALMADGKLFAWGGNDDGQIGNGTDTQAEFPVEIGVF